jgi:hypothetical protein
MFLGGQQGSLRKKQNHHIKAAQGHNPGDWPWVRVHIALQAPAQLPLPSTLHACNLRTEVQGQKNRMSHTFLRNARDKCRKKLLHQQPGQDLLCVSKSWLSLFHILAIVNRAAMNTGVQVSLLYMDSHSLGYMTKSGMAGS